MLLCALGFNFSQKVIFKPTVDWRAVRSYVARMSWSVFVRSNVVIDVLNAELEKIITVRVSNIIV